MWATICNMRRTTSILKHTWPIDGPQRICGGVAACGQIIVPMPVIGQPVFKLEPLARQARILRHGAGDGADLAERLIGRSPPPQTTLSADVHKSATIHTPHSGLRALQT